MFWENPDLLILTGSHLYGTSLESSDEDTRGFVLEPTEYLLKRKIFEQKEYREPDKVIWSFTKFEKLLRDGVVNAIELLFAPKENILCCTEIGKKLLDNRDLYLSKLFLKKASGYAYSEQLKAIGMHKDKETGDVYASTRDLGEKRKTSIEQFGYSTKNAMHTIRLLSQAIELGEKKTITFPRPEKEILMNLRLGKYSKMDFLNLYDEYDQKLLKVIEETDLPDNTGDKTDELYYSIVKTKLKEFLDV